MRPRTIIAKCPGCGSHPEPRMRGLFTVRVRLECACGVAGQWRPCSAQGDGWHDAVDGWSQIFPLDMSKRPPPPAPMR